VTIGQFDKNMKRST